MILIKPPQTKNTLYKLHPPSPQIPMNLDIPDQNPITYHRLIKKTETELHLDHQVEIPNAECVQVQLICTPIPKTKKRHHLHYNIIFENGTTTKVRLGPTIQDHSHPDTSTKIYTKIPKNDWIWQTTQNDTKENLPTNLSRTLPIEQSTK